MAQWLKDEPYFLSGYLEWVLHQTWICNQDYEWDDYIDVMRYIVLTSYEQNYYDLKNPLPDGGEFLDINCRFLAAYKPVDLVEMGRFRAEQLDRILEHLCEYRDVLYPKTTGEGDGAFWLSPILFGSYNWDDISSVETRTLFCQPHFSNGEKETVTHITFFHNGFKEETVYRAKVLADECDFKRKSG